MPRLLACFALLTVLALPAAAGAESAPDAGTAFEPETLSEPLYATAGETNRMVVKAADDVDLFVETWLPAAKDGRTPPAKLPTVLIMTPYVQPGEQRYPARNAEPVVDYFTARGYAVAQHHVRGTGASGGCLEQTSTKQIDDTGRVIEWLGRDAPWANGAVGMYGISYDAEVQISVAGRGDPDRIKYLKAIIPSETVGGQYEYSFMDGVPYTGNALLSNGAYLALTSLTPDTTPQQIPGRLECQGEVLASSADVSGDLTPYWKVREYRPEITKFKAATLWLHGLADWNVQPITMSASFDRIPATTPHKALVGVFEHNYPDKHNVQPDWQRPDWLPMALAWYDRYLKDLRTGVELWPNVQLQDSTGQWRSEPGFPQTGGPVGQLALAADGVLGAPAPTGSTAFAESDSEDRVVLTTPSVGGPLHLTGEVIADLWLTTSMPDGHVTGVLEVLGADGALLAHQGGPAQGTHGARSLRHLDPMPDGYFVQEAGRPAATGEPIRVPLRFQPADLVVPTGGKLRLTIAGQQAYARETAPSGAGSTITLLHSCEKPSALRFLTARPDGLLLNVREIDETGRLISSESSRRVVDGGGLASAKVCGQAPERLDSFGPPKDAKAIQIGGSPPFGPTTCRSCRAPLRVKVVRARLRRALAKGLTVRVNCLGDCPSYRVRVLRGRKVVGSGKAAGGEGKRSIRARFTRSARRSLGRSRRVRLVVEVRAGAQRVRVPLTLRR